MLVLRASPFASKFTSALVLVLVILFGDLSGQGQTLTTLYNFDGTNGASPIGGVVIDSSGSLYGVTAIGGAFDQGVVYKILADGSQTVLHSFRGLIDGADPQAGLIRSPAGTLYGTTFLGGKYGFGTIFRINSNGSFTVLHHFAGAPDGASPNGRLLLDSTGNLYGTTEDGGTGNCSGFSTGCGTVFKLSSDGTETVLYSFQGGTADGASPVAGLTIDGGGNFYGTTGTGGAFGKGTVFEFDFAGTESVLYSFAGGSLDGEEPNTTLVLDATGSLSGTTPAGGMYAKGTAFVVTTNGSETFLHSFGAYDISGSYPSSDLIRDSAGNLYGTTSTGGSRQCAKGGCGTIFKLNTAGKEIQLHAFVNAASQGSDPLGSLVRDAAGNFYGITALGGSSNAGTVFKLSLQ